MKKFLLFLFTALSFCLMTGCGERKMSDEEIQRKIDALYEKVVEAEKNNDSDNYNRSFDVLCFIRRK